MAENDGRNYTTNLEMVLPKQSEQYTVDDFNGNFQKIDDFAGQTPARALTADKLTTGATINNVLFKGDSNIILPVATTSVAGTVKPDGNSITIDENGIINANYEVRLHALKGYADNGELLTDAEGLADVKNYAHSTFDRSKFTVVGNTGLTSDGIIPAGIAQNNKVEANYLLPIWNNNPWEIITPLYKIESVTEWWNTRYLFRYLESNEGVYLYYKGVNGNSTLLIGISLKGDSTIDITANITRPTTDSIQFKIENTGTQYKLYSRLNGIGEWTFLNGAEKTNTFTLTLTEKMNFNYFSSSTDYAPVASCDLKYLKIIDNENLVFSGNKTGIDTVKPVDFNATSNDVPHNNPSLPFSDSGLTITDDGIASGFDGGSNNAIVKQLTVSPTQSLKICCKIHTGALTPNQRILFIDDGSKSANIMIVDSAFRFRTVGNSIITQTASVTANTTYFIEYEMNNSVWTAKISTDGQNWTTVNVGTASWVTGTYQVKIGGLLSGDGYPFKGSVDLNSVRIYIDGNLVYQPCLKIPYTQSKTGSKIVDSIYRDRVNDMAEQFGYAPYYTLGNTDFTLPQVELYGLIERKTADWVYSNSNFNADNLQGTYDYTSKLSSILPADDYKYECLFRYYLNIHGDNDFPRKNANFEVSTNSIKLIEDSLDAQGSTSSDDAIISGGQFIGVIDSKRDLIMKVSQKDFYSVTLILIAYRRIS